jgi:hypothetical protein
MIEQYEVIDADDISVSDDGKTVEIRYKANRNGNYHVEVPVEMLVKLLNPPRATLGACRCGKSEFGDKDYECKTCGGNVSHSR